MGCDGQEGPSILPGTGGMSHEIPWDNGMSQDFLRQSRTALKNDEIKEVDEAGSGNRES